MADVRSIFFAVLITALASGGTAPDSVTIQFDPVSRDVVEKRLRQFSTKASERETKLKAIFAEAGCRGDMLTEQPVKHALQPNVICALPGTTDSVILVGAHFDHRTEGHGVVDNWSGASLLSSLFESLRTRPHKHSFIFVGFTAEEEGLKGSKFYAAKLDAEQLAKIKAMINLDSLGLGPTKVWLSHSNQNLANELLAVANVLRVSLQAVNADRVADEDSHPFRDRKIATLMIHSITQEAFGTLHSSRDDISAIKFADYYDTYRLIAAYLVFLDTKLD